MAGMNKLIRKLAREYMDACEIACNIMMQGLGYCNTLEVKCHRSLQMNPENPWELWRGEFTIDGISYRYFYHGGGCRLEWNDTYLDWDFGAYDVCGCIIPTKLYWYMEENYPDLAGKYDIKYIEEQFQLGVSQGGAHKLFGRYYLEHPEITEEYREFVDRRQLCR